MARGLDLRANAEDSGKDEGVERAPCVELTTLDQESMLGRPKREAEPDEASFVVVLGVLPSLQRFANGLERQSTRRLDLLQRNRLAAHQQDHDRSHQSGHFVARPRLGVRKQAAEVHGALRLVSHLATSSAG